jgi:hypothetical protein
MPCPAAPPTRHWILADRVSESRAQPGFKIDVRLNSVDARDSLGRIAHVRGIYVNATAQFEVVGSQVGNAFVSAYQLRSLFQAMMLEDVTGHAFWPSIDARSVLDDTFFRHWAQVQLPYLATGTQGGALAPIDATQTADYGIAADSGGIGGNTQTIPISWYAPLVTLGPGNNPLGGLLPLAALQRQSGQGSFRFTLGTQIAGAPSGINFAGVLNGEGNPGLDVWLDVVYLPALSIGAAWTLDCYTLPDSSGILRRPEDATEHVQIRYFPDDTPNTGEGALVGASAANNLDIFTLKVAGYTVVPGFSLFDMRSRSLLFAASERDSAITRANAEQDLPWYEFGALAPVNLQALVLLPYRQKGMGEASGDVNFRYGNMGGNSYVRYLHRTVMCNEIDRANAIAESVGCDPCSRTMGTDAKGNPTTVATAKGEILVLDPSARGLASGR